MNKKPLLKIFSATLFFSFFNLSLTKAQAGGDIMTSVVNYTPHFFIAILAGLLLALAIQAILTMVSLASGISLIGNLEEKFSEGRNRRDIEKDRERRDRKERNKDSEETPTSIKITTGAGVWAIVTASISLFVASFLAVKMIFIPFGGLGFVIGLIIWAAFFLVMMYLEARSVNSLLGGIFNTALQGVRSAFGVAKDVFGKSEETKLSNVARNTVGAIHQELATAVNTSDINQKIEAYINRLQPKDVDYSRVKNEIAELFSEIEMDEKVEFTDRGSITKTFLKLAESHPNINKEQARKLGNIVAELKNINAEGGEPSDKLLKAVDKFTPGSEEDTKQFREKIANYLRSTKKEELNPESLKKDFDMMMRDPKSSRDIIKRRMGMMNKSTLVTLLAQRTDMNKDEAEKIVGYAEKALDYVRGRVSEGVSEGQTKAGEAKERAQNLPQEVASRIEDKIRNYLNSLNREEFNYDRLKLDFQNIFNDPSAAFDILKSRLSEYDRESIIALLSSSDRISRADAERMVDKILEARDNVIWKAEKIQDEAKKRFEEAKTFTLHQAEMTRKVAATAAWWLVGAAVVSAIISGLGGMLGIA